MRLLVVVSVHCSKFASGAAQCTYAHKELSNGSSDRPSFPIALSAMPTRKEWYDQVLSSGRPRQIPGEQFAAK